MTKEGLKQNATEFPRSHPDQQRNTPPVGRRTL